MAKKTAKMADLSFDVNTQRMVATLDDKPMRVVMNRRSAGVGAAFKQQLLAGQKVSLRTRRVVMTQILVGEGSYPAGYLFEKDTPQQADEE